MKKRTTWKRIGSLILTLAMVLTMSVTALPVYAAGGGTASVTYKPATDGKVETEFTLYKVGHFEHDSKGQSYLALDAGIPDEGVNVRINKEDYSDDESWTAEWQKSAAALASKIEGTSAPKFTATANKGNGGVAYFADLENGLYLLTGPKQEYMDPDKGENTYFTPNPSFIMVLNGDAKLTVKFTEETVKEYVITKIWEDKGHEALRPESIDVKLSYRDSSEQTETWTEKETVTLNADNKWTYEWKSDPKFEWKWEEIMEDSSAIHYISTPAEKMDQNDNKKYVTLTNTYAKRQLELTKIIDSILENGDNGTTFAFEIKGYMGTGSEERLVYTGSAGINFKGGSGTLTKLVDNIPVNLTRLEVEEVYSGNYKVAGNKKQNATFDIDAQLYKVSFTNNYNDETTITGGIVNKYTNEQGKIVLKDKDAGKAPGAAATPQAE